MKITNREIERMAVDNLQPEDEQEIARALIEKVLFPKLLEIKNLNSAADKEELRLALTPHLSERHAFWYNNSTSLTELYFILEKKFNNDFKSLKEALKIVLAVVDKK